MLSSSRKFNRRTITSAAVAVLVALASSSALASAADIPPGDDDSEAAGKHEACAAIGCPDGSRVCGTAAGKITAGVPPFVGEVSVSWTCYEAGVFQ